jgi:hypothetical protein
VAGIKSLDPAIFQIPYGFFQTVILVKQMESPQYPQYPGFVTNLFRVFYDIANPTVGAAGYDKDSFFILINQGRVLLHIILLPLPVFFLHTYGIGYLKRSDARDFSQINQSIPQMAGFFAGKIPGQLCHLFFGKRCPDISCLICFWQEAIRVSDEFYL